MKKIEIKVQYFLGCPHYAEMLKNVKTAVGKFAGYVEYTEEIVDTNEKAVSTDFRGSPTLLINGKDFEDMPVPEQPSLSCRFYPGGIPSIEKISAVINDLILSDH